MLNFVCFSSFKTDPEVGEQWDVALGAVGLVVLLWQFTNVKMLSRLNVSLRFSASNYYYIIIIIIIINFLL